MKPARHVWIYCTLTGLISFIAGCVFCNVSSIRYDNSLQLSALLEILVTIVVSLIVAWYITKRINEDRFAKEMVIDDLKAIETRITEIVANAHDESKENQKATIQAIYLLHQYIKRLERVSQVNGRLISIEPVMNSFFGFYGSATNFGSEAFDPYRISNAGEDLIVEVRKMIHLINQI